jgi:hypothetical protein
MEFKQMANMLHGTYCSKLGWDLNAQQGLFKLTMKSNVSQMMVKVVALATSKMNPQIVNPLICLWKVIKCFSSLVPYLSKVFKVNQDCYDACFGIH